MGRATEGARTRDLPRMARMVSLPLATSRAVLPFASRRLSSMPSVSSSKLTTSVRDSDAARCSAVVPDPGGYTALGEIDRWDSRSDIVSPDEAMRHRTEVDSS